MEKSEKLALGLGLGLLSLFLAILIYSATVLDIRIPTCLWGKAPFTKGSLENKGGGEYEAHFVARMWSFDPPEITVPWGSTLDIYLSSEDVQHGFHVLNTGVNLMAVPGTVNFARIRFDKPGDYPIVCHEYCGAGHQNMAAVIHVPSGYSAGSLDQTPRLAAAGLPKAEAPSAGAALLASKGCVACHSVNGQPGVAPTFKGLFNSKVTLVDGSEVQVDDAYLMESVKTPAAKVVRGYQPVMPVMPMSETELHAIVDHIKSLK